MAREGVPLTVIQRQLGHSNLSITSIYLQGIDNAEIIDTVHSPPRADGSREHSATDVSEPQCQARCSGHENVARVSFLSVGGRRFG